jgi:hypothetical protein
MLKHFSRRRNGTTSRLRIVTTTLSPVTNAADVETSALSAHALPQSPFRSTKFPQHVMSQEENREQPRSLEDDTARVGMLIKCSDKMSPVCLRISRLHLVVVSSYSFQNKGI